MHLGSLVAKERMDLEMAYAHGRVLSLKRLLGHKNISHRRIKTSMEHGRERKMVLELEIPQWFRYEKQPLLARNLLELVIPAKLFIGVTHVSPNLGHMLLKNDQGDGGSLRRMVLKILPIYKERAKSQSHLRLLL